MANEMAILKKIHRNLKQLGVEVSMVGASVVVENGSNDLTVSYVDADIQKPMGGVDDSVSPFLGIGVANPGTIKIKSAINTDASMIDILDSDVAAQVFAVVCGFANDMVLENSDASFVAAVRGHSDQRGLGM